MKKILIFTLILLLLFVLSIIVRVFLNSSPLVDKFFIITITTGLICLFFYTTFFIFKKIFHKVYPLFKIVDNYLFRKVKIVTILLILISIILIIVSILSKKSQDIFSELIIGLLVTGPLILIFYNVSKSNKLEKITKKLLLIMTLYPLIMYFYFVIQLFSDNPDELSPGQAFGLGLPIFFEYIIFIGIIYFFSRILYFIFQNKKPKINNDRIPTTKE